ncbi:hypothetical protein I203_102211 [Kwoniella mangroviensis CBS 8507]|uniref:uncharacterized protein n=1 Tax=Kwoniella mangroviensis CBS 8507 TaxID=1296122 RepID=UPI00080D02A4|nr:uncharacterized protein I203_03408 [Kwoniella mangroviensis CBS 8507]OCF67710.1 hypothetical protein I203_03408 [Kwoniella mangroviensis CBS 8507]
MSFLQGRKNSFGSVFVESPIIESSENKHTDHLPVPIPAAVADGKGKGKATELSYLIISGGTGANSIASAFGNSPSFVLPVSDDGGSSSEILRCFGGPSIGDIRSRLIRLIPLTPNPTAKDDVERLAIYNLLAYRFPSDAPEKDVRELWHEIVEGRSELWDGIGEDKKECIRAFLVHFQTLCLKRAHKRFSFRNFSLGNGFLTGARDLFGSLPSAIFLFKSIAGVNHGVQVIPVINTNQTVTIAAQLANSTVLVGQCNISHPTSPVPPVSTSSPGAIAPTPSSSSSTKPILSGPLRHHFRRDSRTFDTPDTSLPTSRRTSFDFPQHQIQGQIKEGEVGWSDQKAVGGNLGYRKGEEEAPLEARIERVFYINLYGQEIYPEPNLDFIDSLNQRDILVYSCGSLWTSIIPCLALKGLASVIAGSKSLKAKVLLLNSSNDRETPEYTASQYLSTILDMLRHYDKPKRNKAIQGVPASSDSSWNVKPSDLISHVIHLEGGKVGIDMNVIETLGVELIRVPSDVHGYKHDQIPLFSPETVEWAMEKVLEN